MKVSRAYAPVRIAAILVVVFLEGCSQTATPRSRVGRRCLRRRRERGRRRLQQRVHRRSDREHQLAVALLLGKWDSRHDPARGPGQLRLFRWRRGSGCGSGNFFMAGAAGPTVSVLVPCYWENGALSYLTAGTSTAGIASAILAVGQTLVCRRRRGIIHCVPDPLFLDKRDAVTSCRGDGQLVRPGLCRRAGREGKRLCCRRGRPIQRFPAACLLVQWRLEPSHLGQREQHLWSRDERGDRLQRECLFCRERGNFQRRACSPCYWENGDPDHPAGGNGKLGWLGKRRGGGRFRETSG